MSDKKAQRRLQGERARASGHRFEARLELAFAYYRRLGVADIEKTPEPMQIIKSLDGGRFVTVFEKKAQPDYSGVLKGGRAVVFEAKYRSSDHMEQDRVTLEQGRALDRRQELGALCFVLAGFASGKVYRLPWEVWRQMREIFGKASVRERDIEGYAVPVVGGVPMVLAGL